MRVLLRGAALAGAGLLLAGCGGLAGTGDLQYVPGEGNVLEVPAGERGAPVELEGRSLQGEPDRPRGRPR